MHAGVHKLHESRGLWDGMRETHFVRVEAQHLEVGKLWAVRAAVVLAHVASR